MSRACKKIINLITLSVAFFIPLVFKFNISAQSFHTVNNQTITTGVYQEYIVHFLLALILLLFLFFIAISYFHSKKFSRLLSFGTFTILIITNFILTFFSSCSFCYLLVTCNYFLGILDFIIVLNEDRLFIDKDDDESSLDIFDEEITK